MRWSEVAPRSWRLGPVVHGTVWGDEEVLRAAMDALVENAVKFTDVGEPIELRARMLDFGLVLDVIDGGPGIDPDKIERIFERFGRGDDARSRATGGVGLGLAIVRAVADVHGGSCVVASRPGRTVFSLRLPNFQRELERPHPSAAMCLRRDAMSYARPRSGGTFALALVLVRDELDDRQWVGGDPGIPSETP